MAPVKQNTNNNTKVPSKLLKTSKLKKTTLCMKYDPQKIVNTMEAVKYGTMNVTEASKVFDIPRQTLSDRIKGKYTKAGGGGKTELTEDEERILVDYCIFMVKCSHPLTVPVVQAFTWAIVRKTISHQGFMLQMVQVGSGGKVLKRDILRYP